MEPKSMTIQIRQHKPSDNEFILSLVPRFSEFELPEWRQGDEIDSTNQASIERALNQPGPDSAIFMAEDENGSLAGFIHLQTETDYFRDEKYGYISDLAVDAAFEGQGIGRTLLETAEEWARTKGYRLLALYVFSGNRRARQLYEKYGFKEEVIKYAKAV
jgi:ribosomal protein S18 acetylase RimI-like enzyme